MTKDCYEEKSHGIGLVYWADYVNCIPNTGTKEYPLYLK